MKDEYCILIMIILVVGLIILFGFREGINTTTMAISDLKNDFRCPAVTVQSPNVSLSCPGINASEINLKCPACITHEWTSHFQDVISSVCIERPYEYDHSGWNCDEMSREGVKRVANSGYKDIRMACGLANITGKFERHCWGIYGKEMIIEFSKCYIVNPSKWDKYKED